MLYRVHLARGGFELATLVVIGTDCIGSYKSNYHTITTTTAPKNKYIIHAWLFIIYFLIFFYLFGINGHLRDLKINPEIVGLNICNVCVNIRLCIIRK